VCPFAYFVREILHIEPVENPEDRLRISPLDLGSLVHEVLETFITRVLVRPAAEQPAPHQAWSEDDEHLLAGIVADACDRYEAHGVVGRQIFWQRDRHRILADVARFLREDSAYRAAFGTRPVAAELAFGMPGAPLGTVALPLPDGRHVRFRGKADRLDVADDGILDVTDYKTGSFRRYLNLSVDDPDAGGTKLQLPVYALAARAHQGVEDAPVHSAYWFASRRGEFRRIGYVVTSEVLERVGSTVGRMVAGIEGGVFPHNPTATSTQPFPDCPYCDPDGLGVTDLHRQIAAKRADPALSLFFDLAEGPREADLLAAAVGDGDG
jgi:RecB family exonuclease